MLSGPISINTSKKIALLGVGNTLRTDDGIGAYICSQIDAMNFATVTTIIVQQLHVELIEDLLHYDAVIIADASITGHNADLYPLASDETQVASSSHHLNANMLNALAKKMYGKDIAIFLCSVRGENFEIGESLSSFAITNANNAVKQICDWIKNN